jgi:hypothetical protein
MIPVTALKAIRLKCLDCSCGSAYEVQRCTPSSPARCGIIGEAAIPTGRIESTALKSGPRWARA